MKLYKITAWILWLLVALVITAIVDALVWKDVPAWLMPVNTLMTFAVACLHAGQHQGWWRALTLFAIVFVVSITFESFGVATGVIYGPYQYLDNLGPKLLGVVPVLIPIAWFMMTYPSFTIADIVIPTDIIHPARRRWVVAAVGAVVMTAWDLSMDPLMSASGYWKWGVQGAFFNVPLQNFWGWWLTSFTALLVYQILVAELKIPVHTAEKNAPLVWAIFIYIITGISSVTMDFIFGLGGAGLAGLFAMLPWVVAAAVRLKNY